MSKPDVRERIQNAAQSRFGQYGFSKTTLADIAGDCQMSPANVYRYFKNKEEIGMAIAMRYFEEQAAVFEQALTLPGSAEERLLAYVLSNLRFEYGNFAQAPHIHELVDYVCKENWELVQDRINYKNEVIAKIIRYGVERGEFVIEDVTQAAEFFCIAAVKFQMPLFMHQYPLAELERMARGVVDLLIHGLHRT